MKTKRVLCALTVLLMMCRLTSCGAASKDNATSSYMSESVSYDTVAEESFGTYSDASYTSLSSMEEGSAVNDLSERKIIKTAVLRYQTKEYDEFFSGLNSCIQKYGAYIEAEESYGGNRYNVYSNRSATLTVRVPLDTYNEFMSDACTIGSVIYKSENSSDVTTAYVDTESRITALETEYSALLSILEKADKLDDVISLQSRISEVTYELENYKSQLRKYDNLISYCTVNIDVDEVERVTPNVEEMTFGEKIRSGLSENLENIADDATDFAIWFVTSLPYILIWAVVILILGTLIRRQMLKHRKNKMPKEDVKTSDSVKMEEKSSEHENSESNQTNS